MTQGFELSGRRVWVAGHNGMVGSAIVRRLATEGCDILIAPRREVDLRDPHSLGAWMAEAKPQAVFMAAARVGGILANDTRPAEFLYDNLMIEANVTEACRRHSVVKMLFLGSSCIYPKFASQPLREEYLLTGALEPTNEWYAVAKIAGIKLAQAYRQQYGLDMIAAMPTNLYGPNDNFDLASSHVLPALLRKIHEAKISGVSSVQIWGSGQPLREFLHVDDLADACVFLMKHYSASEIVNVGTGQDLRIADLANQIAKVVGWSGEFVYDASKPDGTPKKQLDVSRLRNLGWCSSVSIEQGLASTYSWFLDNIANPALRLEDA